MQVFNPYANGYARSTPDSKKYHKSIKKLKYEQKIIKVKKANFCPLIFSGTGEVVSSVSEDISRLTSRISDQKKPYSDMMMDIRTKTNFALLRSFILRLRGERSMHRRAAVEVSIGAIIEEGRLLS